MNKKLSLLLLFCLISGTLLQSQESVNEDDFSDLLKAKTRRDSIILSRLSPAEISAEGISQSPRLNYTDSYGSPDPAARNLPLLILLIIAFILVIVLMIIQLNLRQKMKKIQQLEEMKSQHKTRTLLKSIEAQKQDLNRLRKIESSFSDLRAQQEQWQDKVKRYELLQKTIVALRYPVVLTNLQGNIIFCNLEFAQLHGYRASELLGKNLSKLFPETAICTIDNREQWEKDVLSVVSRHKSGTQLNLYAKAALLLNADNNPDSIVTTFDLIQETAKEDRSEDYEKVCGEKLRIFENILDVYYEVNIDGVIREISPSISATTGYSRDELIGREMNLLYADEDQQQKFVSALKKERDLSDYEILLKKKNGETISCSITARLLVDDDKMPYLIIGIIRDITLQKQEAEKPSKAMEELKMVNKDLLDFAYITSHDLKSPLRAINTLANWVVMDEENRLSQESKTQMQLLISRTERMHNLIDAIFDYTNIINFIGEKSIIDVNALLSGLLKRMSIPENVSVKVQENIPSLLFERSRIEQIFENLIENSVKFMDKEKGVVVVEWAERAKEIEFTVTDNGPGIDPKYFDKVFEIFQTLKPRDEVEGVGIGLAIVRKIITKYGGKIWLKSTPGEGLAVSFTFPKSDV